MRRQCDNVELAIWQAGYEELCERMLASEIDLGLFVETPDLAERLHRWPLFTERYVLLCSPDHRFKDCTMISPPDLSEECVLVNANAACPLRRYLDAICEQHSVQPRSRHFASSQEQIIEMVRAALGVSVAGEWLADSAALPHRPIAADPDRRTIVVSTVAGRLLGPTPSLFLKLMRARGWRAENDADMPAAA
jgi:DNA-binding transcriptional LysR family regulator